MTFLVCKTLNTQDRYIGEMNSHNYHGIMYVVYMLPIDFILIISTQKSNCNITSTCALLIHVYTISYENYQTIVDKNFLITNFENG